MTLMRGFMEDVKIDKAIKFPVSIYTWVRSPRIKLQRDSPTFDI